MRVLDVGGGVIDEDIANDSYVVVPNPGGIPEKDIMDSFDATRNMGVWPIQDCHDKIDWVLEYHGLQNPGAPGGKWGAIPRGPSGTGGSGK